MSDNKILLPGDLAFLYILLSNGELADLEEVTANRLQEILWRLLRDAQTGPGQEDKLPGDRLLDLVSENFDGVATKAVMFAEFLGEEDGEERFAIIRSSGSTMWDIRGLIEVGRDHLRQGYARSQYDEDE